ncbi:MAG: sodium:solute symporter family protein [Candidatus Bathyarchaeia archaeon]
MSMGRAEIVLLSIAIYLAIMLAIGLAFSKKVKTALDFATAGRGLSFWLYVLLMAGSLMSGMTAMGVAGLGFQAAYQTWWEQLAVPLSIAICTAIYGPKLNAVGRRLGFATVQDYLAFRYYDAKLVRGISGLISIFVSAVYLIGQYVAIGIVLKVLMGWEYWQGLLLTGAIVILYVMAGGLFAVAWTTLFQGLILVIGVVLMLPPILGSVGGFASMNEALGTVKPIGPFKPPGLDMPFGSFEFLTTPLYNLTLFGLSVFLGLSVAPHIINNVFAFRDAKCIKWGPLAGFILGAIVLSSTKLMGIAGRVAWSKGLIDIPSHPVVPGAKWSDMVLPVMIEFAVPPMLWGLFAVVILAAVMSTTDRLLLTIGTNFSWDLYKNLLNPRASDRAIMLIGRAVVAIVGCLTILAALSPPALIAWLIWAALGMMFSTWFVVLVGGLFWRRGTREGCIGGMLSGFLSTVVAGIIDGGGIWPPPLGFRFPFYYAVIGFVTSSLVFVAVSLATKRPPERVIEDSLTGPFLRWAGK